MQYYIQYYIQFFLSIFNLGARFILERSFSEGRGKVVGAPPLAGQGRPVNF